MSATRDRKRKPLPTFDLSEIIPVGKKYLQPTPPPPPKTSGPNLSGCFSGPLVWNKAKTTETNNGRTDSFAMAITGAFDVAKTNAEMTARNEQVVRLVGRAEAAELVPLPFGDMGEFMRHVECQ